MTDKQLELLCELSANLIFLNIYLDGIGIEIIEKPIKRSNEICIELLKEDYKVNNNE